jgi:hypothetical protein
MITEIVTFEVPEGTTREAIVAKFEATAPIWQANQDLVRKYYIFDAERRIAGGVYLWREREHAERWHGEAFRQKVKEIYGAEPRSQFFDSPIVVDNLTGAITKY